MATIYKSKIDTWALIVLVVAIAVSAFSGMTVGKSTLAKRFCVA
jgi:hypothetical protein